MKIIKHRTVRSINAIDKKKSIEKFKENSYFKT